MVSVKSIPIALFRKFLVSQGLKHISTKGGHEKWSRKDLPRPVIIQNHGSKTIEFHIVSSNLKTLNISRLTLEQWLNENPK